LIDVALTPSCSTQFIREQDGVIKENQKKLAAGLTGNFAEAQKSYESQIKVLQEDIARLKVRRRVRPMVASVGLTSFLWQLNLKEQERRYRAEYHALFSACQDMSSKLSRGGGGGGIGIGGVKEPVSWLAQQRKNVSLFLFLWDVSSG
jgi:protein HOOK3